MIFAITTDGLAPDTPTALQKVSDLGYQHLQLDLLSAELNYNYRRLVDVAFYRQLQKQIERLGLQVIAVRLPPLTQPQMFSLRARKELLINTIGLAGSLGAKTVVCEPAHIFTDEEAVTRYLRQKGAPPIIEGWDSAWAQAINRHLQLALLNRDYWIGSPLTNHIAQCAQITTDLGIQWACDVAVARQHQPLQKWLSQLGERLALAYTESDDESKNLALREEIGRTAPLIFRKPPQLN